MKNVTQAYTDKEEATQRKPVELYHLWMDSGSNWYYTSGDTKIIFDTHTFLPATLERTSLRYNSELEVQTIKIVASYLDNSTLKYLTLNPISPTWIKIMKLHRDQVPLEADIIFVGQIKKVAFKGVKAMIDCVGFEHYLNKTIPRWRYQLTCNHMLFDSKCNLSKATYKVSTAITLDATGLIVTSPDFGLKADGYFTGGELIYNGESRGISAHVGNSITLIYKMITLETGFTVDTYPGCDGRLETCRDTFSNINNSLGFPFIPVENPALRVSW